MNGDCPAALTIRLSSSCCLLSLSFPLFTNFWKNHCCLLLPSAILSFGLMAIWFAPQHCWDCTLQLTTPSLCRTGTHSSFPGGLSSLFPSCFFNFIVCFPQCSSHCSLHKAFSNCLSVCSLLGDPVYSGGFGDHIPCHVHLFTHPFVQ